MSTTSGGKQVVRQLRPRTLAGQLDSLPILANYVCWAARKADISIKATYRLRLAVDEIATNIIIHGYTDAGQRGTLHVSAHWDDTYLTIILEDMGISYNPAQASIPEKLNCPVQERPLGGLGIYLALWGVDEFYYKALTDRNRSTFLVKRSEQ